MPMRRPSQARFRRRGVALWITRLLSLIGQLKAVKLLSYSRRNDFDGELQNVLTNRGDFIFLTIGSR